MGSYFQTCGISQLPIYHGDKVRYFILCKYPRDNFHNDSITYPNSIWSSLGAPIVGSYFDYGRLSFYKDSFVMTPSIQILMDCLANNFAVKDGKDFKSKKFAGTFEELCHTIGSTDSFILSEEVRDERKPLCLNDMFVHEDIFLEIVNFAFKEKHEGKALMLDKLKSDAELWYNCIQNNLDSFDKERLKENNLPLSLKKEIIGGYNLFSWWMTNNFSKPFCFGMPEYLLFLAKRAMNNVQFSDNTNQSVFNDIYSWYAFDHSLSLLRKSYAPQSGQGSQCLEYAFHKKVLKASLKLCNEKIKKIKEDS